MKRQSLKIAFSSIGAILLFGGCTIESDKELQDTLGELFGDNTVIDKNITESDNIEIVENNSTVILDEIFKVEDNQTKSLYSGTPDDPIYAYQWHLKNLNLDDIWAKYSGKGIKIGLIDSGIQWNHQDLYDNIDFNLSYRYSDKSHNPSPDEEQLKSSPFESGHGTACAGIIGAIGWNKEGVIGVAPLSDLVGLNAFSTGKNSDFEDALGNIYVDISSNSWGGGDSTILYDDPDSMRGVERGIALGRYSKGVIYIFASGNEGNNANYSTLHGSRYILNIGAVTVDGDVPTYSNYGDNLLIVAPAGDALLSKNRGIFTTDLTGTNYGIENYFEFTRVLRYYNGDYTGLMNGTSSAVPVVSGAVALLLEANPKLTYRDVKYILSKTADVENKDDAKYLWEINGAGIEFSPYYGFGILNIQNAIEMAENFEGLGNEREISKSKSPYYQIEDLETFSSEIDIDENLTIEHVEIYVNIPDHKRVGDLEISLTSPSGTISYLTFGDGELQGSFENWSFNSRKFLDESSFGIWKLSITDREYRYIGTIQDWKLNIYGH